MEMKDETTKRLGAGSGLSAIEGSHRERLKRALLERAASHQEEKKMRLGKIAIYAASILLMLGAAGATGRYVFLRMNTGRPEVTMQEPIAVAETVLAALQEQDFSMVEGVFPSKDLLASAWPPDHPFVARYDELKTKLRAEFDQCLADYPDLAGAKLVRVDGDYGEGPTSEKERSPVEFFDNAHFFLQIGDLIYDIRLDELVKLGDAWYLVELPGTNGAMEPISLDQLPPQPKEE